jgi:hypothetical protein
MNMDFITGKSSKSKSIWKRFGVHLQRRKSSSVKIWSDPVQKKRKSKRKHQSQMNGIIEKRYGESLKSLSSKIPKGVYVLKIEAFSF